MVSKKQFIEFLVLGTGKYHTQTALHDFHLEAKEDFEADIVVKVPKNKTACYQTRITGGKIERE